MELEAKQTLDENESWLRKKEKRERKLKIIIWFLILCCLILIIVIVVISLRTRGSNICTTPECVTASARIINALDFTIDPCQDFYQFVCGKFVRNTAIPKDKSSVSAFSIIRDKVEKQIKEVVEESPPEAAPKQYHFVKRIFTMCLNSTEIEANSLPTAKSILHKVGGWPLLEGNRWKEDDFQWTDFMHKLRKTGIGTNFFISVLITTDLKNSARRVINIAEASLDLDRENLVKGRSNPTIKAYYDYMVDLAVLFGADRQRALDELQETLDFEIKLARICLPQEERRNLTAFYNALTIGELQVKYPFVSWLNLITNIMSTPEIEVTESEIVLVDSLQFLTKIDDLLRQTSKRIQANYIARVIANNFVAYLGKDIRDRKRLFQSMLNGQSVSKQRWQECLMVAQKIGRFPIEASYVRKYFNIESKKQVSELITGIRSAFKNRVHTLDWIDKDTKNRIFEKLESVKAGVGFPDELLDDRNVEEYYSKLEFTSDNYFQTMIDFSTFYMNEHYSKLRKPVNATDWQDNSGASTVNAFYSGSQNAIMLPAGILQDDFYQKDRPQYLNYGAIGNTIGHELIHGFDDIGSQLDKDGNVRDWWGEDTKRSFLEKSKCVVEQYSNYTVPDIGVKVNGINTLGENIADIGGAIQSYLAYQDWAKRNGPELPLPGLDFTQNQLFWISGATVECEVEKIESQRTSVEIESHSPSVLRVNGVYSNIPYFGSDFRCPLGTKMNPVHKCSVW